MLQPASPDNEHVGDLLLNTPFVPRRHVRSTSDTVPRSPGLLARLSNEQAASRYTNAMGDRGLGRSVSLSSPIKSRTTPERPPRPQHGLFEFPAIDGQASTQRAPIGRDPVAQSSTAKCPVQLPSPPECKLGNDSSSRVPFVIAMGSPHNLTLNTPSAMAPTPCSITRYAPFTAIPTTSRNGVGGNVASFTPATFHAYTTAVYDLEPSVKPGTAKPLSDPPGPPHRTLSLSERQDRVLPQPCTPSHSRTASGVSIHTAIRLPKTKDKAKTGKDSASMPGPLVSSPFSLDQSASARVGVCAGPESLTHISASWASEPI
jgi:hypothetical protein